jgi:hypothetical protein
MGQRRLRLARYRRGIKLNGGVDLGIPQHRRHQHDLLGDAGGKVALLKSAHHLDGGEGRQSHHRDNRQHQRQRDARAQGFHGSAPICSTGAVKI